MNALIHTVGQGILYLVPTNQIFLESVVTIAADNPIGQMNSAVFMHIAAYPVLQPPDLRRREVGFSKMIGDLFVDFIQILSLDAEDTVAFDITVKPAALPVIPQKGLGYFIQAFIQLHFFFQRVVIEFFHHKIVEITRLHITAAFLANNFPIL